MAGILFQNGAILYREDTGILWGTSDWCCCDCNPCSLPVCVTIDGEEYEVPGTYSDLALPTGCSLNCSDPSDDGPYMQIGLSCEYDEATGKARILIRIVFYCYVGTEIDILAGGDGEVLLDLCNDPAECGSTDIAMQDSAIPPGTVCTISATACGGECSSTPQRVMLRSRATSWDRTELIVPSEPPFDVLEYSISTSGEWEVVLDIANKTFTPLQLLPAVTCQIVEDTAVLTGILRPSDSHDLAVYHGRDKVFTWTRP